MRWLGLSRFVLALLDLVCVWLDGFGLASVASAWPGLGLISVGFVVKHASSSVVMMCHMFNMRFWLGSGPNRGHRVTAILMTLASLGCSSLGWAWPDLAPLEWLGTCRLNPIGDAI